MRVLIVEDEQGARDDLISILKEISSSIEVAGTTESVMQTLAWLAGNVAPDLIFMDIHLSDGLAFEIFRRTQVASPVIFTTAYDEYALNAFRVNAIDYLLKPISSTEMRRSLEKYHRVSRPPVTDHVARLYEMLTRPPQYAKSILISFRNKLLPVPVEDISFFYSTKELSKVFLADGRSFPYNRTLDHVCSELDPNLFRRVNKQYVVAKRHIRDMVLWSNSRLRLTMDAEGPEPIFLSKNRAAEFKRWLTT